MRIAVANSASELVAAVGVAVGGVLAISIGYGGVFSVALGFQVAGALMVLFFVDEPRWRST